MQTDEILSLKLALDVAVTGFDLATLFGPKFTAFGIANIEPVTALLNIKVAAIQREEGRKILADWAKDSHANPEGMTLFSGHASYILAPAPQRYCFTLSPTAQVECIQWMREAENTFREERDVPRIGEGWVAETALFYEIKREFQGEAVVQHGRPAWLGRQHLDVFLPDRLVAIEYQGAQHDRPVAFFGGEESFLRNQMRDKRKLALCRANGVKMIYVREGYNLDTIVAEIKARG